MSATEDPICPDCGSEFSYRLGDVQVCSMCAHEWSTEPAEVVLIKDAVGNLLTDGDSVIVIQDLKVKGAAGAIKKGTKVRGIRLVEAVDGHDIDCKVDGFGRMQLKSSVVKRA